MYLYHAHAVALGGVLERPAQTIEGQAACSLSIAGGTSSASAGKFDNGLISFDSAQSHLTGNAEKRNGKDVYFTSVSILINGLNVRNMFKADQIVTQITSEHEPSSNPEASIITTGSHFDNLKIAGHVATIEMVHDVFHQFPTFQHCSDAWSKGKPADKGKLRETLLGKDLPAPPTGGYPEHLKDVYDGFQRQNKDKTLRPTVLCSFVKEVKGVNGGGIDTWGPIIKIPQFGTIYLGEVIISHGRRRVNMFRLQLGSPQSGGGAGGSGDSNGTTFPPS